MFNLKNTYQMEEYDHTETMVYDRYTQQYYNVSGPWDICDRIFKNLKSNIATYVREVSVFPTENKIRTLEDFKKAHDIVSQQYETGLESMKDSKKQFIYHTKRHFDTNGVLVYSKAKLIGILKNSVIFELDVYDRFCNIDNDESIKYAIKSDERYIVLRTSRVLEHIHASIYCPPLQSYSSIDSFTGDTDREIMDSLFMKEMNDRKGIGSAN